MKSINESIQVFENNQLTDTNQLLDSDHSKFYAVVEIKISDSGVGMSPENLDKLFVNFGKLSENSNLNKTGTGLGLSICKMFIEKMGGHVSVTSEVNKGTTFTIDFKTKCEGQVPKKEEVLGDSDDAISFSSFGDSNRNFVFIETRQDQEIQCNLSDYRPSGERHNRANAGEIEIEQNQYIDSFKSEADIIKEIELRTIMLNRRISSRMSRQDFLSHLLN